VEAANLTCSTWSMFEMVRLANRGGVAGSAGRREEGGREGRRRQKEAPRVRLYGKGRTLLGGGIDVKAANLVGFTWPMLGEVRLPNHGGVAGSAARREEGGTERNKEGGGSSGCDVRW